jgi:mannose-6-phosphate isomerase
MKLTEPIFFEPLFMERVWGGRRLETLFGKPLPNGAPIGESWEMVDREEAQSVVHEGILKGKTLNELWTEHRTPVFGERYENGPERFPLLIKLLDADERLSVQVHPPAHMAAELKGEPKTEMWYVAWADTHADMFAGLTHTTTQTEFKEALSSGHVAELLHRIPTHAGDCIFIPSGRIHAIGAGNVIVEVQQNSDTTYRVFDWNRVGLDGKPRTLHIEESIASIDFEDAQPQLQEKGSEPLVKCEYFKVQHWTLDTPKPATESGNFAIITVLTGAVRCANLEFKPGQFFLVPASLEESFLIPTKPGTTLLSTTLP